MKTKINQTTRTGTESEKCTSQGVFSGSGEGKGRNRRRKVQGRRSIISRHKIDRER